MKLSEDRFVERVCQSWSGHKRLLVGPGDDCAVIDIGKKDAVELLKTDAIVEGVHFTFDMKPKLIGRKALARVMSDFAAMGGTLTAAVVAILVPEKLDVKFVQSCYQGMNRLAKEYDIALAGGETSRGQQLAFCVSGIGWVKSRNYILRSTAQVGDAIFVTGKLGGSFPKRHLTFVPRLQEGQWLAEHRFASAMMDLSDGLGKDLPRLAKASKLSFRIDVEKIPLSRNCTVDQAVNDGEDYELLFTVPQKKVTALLKKWPFATSVCCIGEMLSASKTPEANGLKMIGFDHFRNVHEI